MSRKRNSFVLRLRRWRRGARWARQKLAKAPRAARIAGVVAILLAAFTLTNLIYHVIHKPTELFFFVGHRLDKEPAETWRQYGPLFRTYSTSTITPELLAALAQGESSGNPVDRTYWRWRFSFNPFSIYQPASSAVGLFQMTDPAYAEVARFCIRANAVIEGRDYPSNKPFYSGSDLVGLIERGRYGFLPLSCGARYGISRLVDSLNCYEIIQRGFVIPRSNNNHERILYS